MSFFKRAGIMLFSLLFMLAALVHAQSFKLNLTAINNSNGLSQHTIQCILKDRYGFMWFGTQDGLNKYDGYEFTVYKHRFKNPYSLPANNITAVCEDSNGNIWAGTRTGGLSKYDHALNKFTNFSFNHQNATSISSNSINTIYYDKHNNLWIGTANGLNLFDDKKCKFKRYLPVTNKANSLSNANILSIFEDSQNNFWVGTSNGLNLLDRATGQWRRFIESTGINQKTDNTINTISEDDSRNLWLGTNKGLKLLNRSNSTFTYYAINGDQNSPKGINPIASLTKTSGNRFWIATYSTLKLFDASKRKLIPVDNKTGESLMPNDGIYALLEDNEGILWIGTSSEGILKHDRNLSIFSSNKSTFARAPSAQNIVRAIDKDSKGKLYLATDEGLDYFDLSNCSYKTYNHQPNNPNSLASNYTTVVLNSKKSNTVWIGTDNSGLDCLNPQTGIFKHYAKGEGPVHLTDNTVYALLEDRHGNIWIGTYRGGINIFNPATQTFSKHLSNPKQPGTMGDNSIQALYEDRAGRIWVGGYSNGVSIYDPLTKQFTQLNSRNSGLNCNIISMFYEDAKGNMWIGTMEGGLNCYNPKTKKFIAYTEEDGLINNTINYIADDSQGNLWLSTNSGVTRFTPATKAFKNFDTHNGLTSMEFNIGAGIKLSNGEIAIGNINGFNVINPQKLAFNHNKPKVAIVGLELFNKVVPIGQRGSPLKQSIITTKEITLSHSQSAFSIDYVALGYTTPSQNRYAYMLAGFDTGWQYVGGQRKATYTNLDPGTYTFKVKAANNDGVWNENATTLIITIKPPFWKTWWCRTLFFLFIAALCYAIYLYRKKQQDKLKAIKEEQFKETVNAVVSAQEEERRRIAESLHNEFGQLLFIAKMHIPAGHLEATKILNEAISKVRSISYELMPPILEDYGLEFALKDMFSKKLTDEGIQYRAEITGLQKRTTQFIEIAVYRILQELLNNVVKHAKADFVEIKLYKHSHSIAIIMTDNGVGMTEESTSLREKKKEFGLNYIKNRIKLLKGNIIIDKAEPKGTSISIELPVHDEFSQNN